MHVRIHTQGWGQRCRTVRSSMASTLTKRTVLHVVSSCLPFARRSLLMMSSEPRRSFGCWLGGVCSPCVRVEGRERRTERAGQVPERMHASSHLHEMACMRGTGFAFARATARRGLSHPALLSNAHKHTHTHTQFMLFIKVSSECS